MILTRRSVSIAIVLTATIPAHPEMMGRGVLGIYVIDISVINNNLSIILVQLKVPHVPP